MGLTSKSLRNKAELLECFDRVSCLVLPVPGPRETLRFLARDSLAEASNFSEIAAKLLKPDFLAKLDELRSFLLTPLSRLKGFVSLAAFGAFLADALGFVQSDQHEQKLRALFERNFRVFEESLLRRFASEVAGELGSLERLSTSFARLNGALPP